ncbi:Crossover junction endonuclease MUS81 [Ceratocystis lukuohia]|uniref:Crossover junction endonuclease MUS81 n=1 Tax=Ceratocystis lukuohia TaxID=2019550 RepID=A0ABR4MAP6_9PEZI
MDDSDANSANPLLLSWVKEWLDTAREHNTKGAAVYRHAYDSLKACPITFQHPSQLDQLRGFGPKICGRLTEKLKQHCEANGLPMPQNVRKRPADPGPVVDSTHGDEEAPQPKRAAKKRQYIPSYRSGAYSIVMALSSMDQSSSAAQGLTKQTVIDLAQPHCDTSFKAPPDPRKFYTAWNSVKTLIEKELVTERGRPLRKYALTDLGWETAHKLRAAATAADNAQGTKKRGKGAKQRAATAFDEQIKCSRTTSAPSDPALLSNENSYDDLAVEDNMRENYEAESQSLGNDSVGNNTGGSIIDIDDSDDSDEAVRISGPKSPSNLANLSAIRPVQIPANSFTVELVLDVREVRTKTDRDYMQHNLSTLGVKPIMRSLELGDAQWIAKFQDPHLLRRLGAEGDELMLDWIVERKRLDDLICSIRDGRFHEQKFRLKRSGVENVVYIIEEKSLDSLYHKKYAEIMTSAMASIQVVDGYSIKSTRSMDETVQYLVRMTNLLRRVYSKKQIHVIPSAGLTANTYLPALEMLRKAEPHHGFYVSYEVFSAMTSKSDLLTLRDLFLKMLMTTKGISAEKAVEIQKIWHTPYEFAKAYEACTSEDAKREMVLKGLCHLMGRKRVGKAASERLAEVWGT